MSDSKKLTSPTQRSVDAFLQKLKETPPAMSSGSRGRLLFALDATASREPTWNQAKAIQASMFEEAANLGGLEIQLCFYRGPGGFSASAWLDRADDLRRRMAEVECVGGYTQIARVLDHTLKEARGGRVNALVFVGDCVEENLETLNALAGQLALSGVRAFMFQEGNDPVATVAFRQIAGITGGAHCRFDAGSAKQLRELLGAVAAYAAGGMKALEDLGRRRGGAALLLTQQVKKS